MDGTAKKELRTVAGWMVTVTRTPKGYEVHEGWTMVCVVDPRELVEVLVAGDSAQEGCGE